MFKVIFTKNIYSLDEKQYFRIILPIIILLFAGMTHTGFTIPYLQFLAYAHLIASMIAKTVDVCLTNKEKRLDTIISVVYLTLFSMAIPVIYPTWSAAPLNVFIYLAEYSHTSFTISNIEISFFLLNFVAPDMLGLSGISLSSL